MPIICHFDTWRQYNALPYKRHSLLLYWIIFISWSIQVLPSAVQGYKNNISVSKFEIKLLCTCTVLFRYYNCWSNQRCTLILMLALIILFGNLPINLYSRWYCVLHLWHLLLHYDSLQSHLSLEWKVFNDLWRLVFHFELNQDCGHRHHVEDIVKASATT